MPQGITRSSKSRDPFFFENSSLRGGRTNVEGDELEEGGHEGLLEDGGAHGRHLGHHEPARARTHLAFGANNLM